MSGLAKITLITIPIGVLSILLLTMPVAAAAGGDMGACPATYTVQRGDTLYSIAVRHNTTVAALMNLNAGRIWNPNLIYAGQVVCVPGAALGARRVTLEVTYQFSPTVDEKGWNLTTRGGYVGKQTAYLIQVVDVVSTPQELVASLGTTSIPILAGIRNDDQGKGYTLVSIGRPDILSSLRLTGTVQTVQECLVAPSVGIALGDDSAKPIEPRGVVLSMEAGGVRYPFYIEKVQVVHDLALFKTCYTGVGKDADLAFLLSAPQRTSSEYRVVMLLQGHYFGPPGVDRETRCAYWPSNGYFYRWMRAWYGCAW